jgi:hypothetical protein
MLGLIAMLAIAPWGANRVGTAMKMAARNGNLMQLASLVQTAKQQPISLNPILLEASSYGRIKVIQYLIAQGADDYSGALVYASLRNQIQAVRYLLEHGDAHIDDQDLLMARLAAGSADSTEAEFYLHVHLMHH